MKNFSAKVPTRRLTALGVAVAVTIGLSVAPSTAPTFAAVSPPTPVGLGTAGSFAVLAGQLVEVRGTGTQISGNVGVSPAAAVTGLLPADVKNGTIYTADTVAAVAQADLTIAYLNADGRTPAVPLERVNLGGQSLRSGVYSAGELALTGTVTLVGDASSVFIFQAASTLITASNSVVALDGVNPCNVFWQVDSSATLGSGSQFVGTVLALTSITAGSGATVEGRLLARNAKVDLEGGNRITAPSNCASGTTVVDNTRSATPAVPVPGRAGYTG